MANQVYENVVLASKIEDILTTSVDLQNYMTIDTSMTEQAGMKKRINTYTASSSVEDLAMGVGNSKTTEVSFESTDYDVTTAQGRFKYYDEQAMTDPVIVDAGLKGLAQDMVNDFTTKAIAEYEKATLATTPTAWTFDAVADAIAELNVEDESGLFLLISVKDLAAFRKNLKDYLSYSEGYVRTGYVGTVCGVPVVASKAVESGKGYLATPEAVTLFIKKDTEVEQERSADLRENTVYIRKVSVVALTDATKAVKITITAA